MSSGAQHDKHGAACATVIVIASCAGFGINQPWPGMCLAAGVLFGTWWLSPDLDLAHSRPSRRWGPFRVLWWPYAKAFPHRGMSHHWLLGPLSRLLYLGVLLIPVAIACGLPPAGVGSACFVIGIILGSWIHLIADGLIF